MRAPGHLTDWAARRNIAFAILDHQRFKNDRFMFSESVTRRKLFLHNRAARDTYLQGPDLDGLIGSASAYGYSYILVQAIGHYMHDPVQFVEALERHIAMKPFVVGNIVDLGDAYYNLNTQCLFVDLNIWQELGKPRFGTAESTPKSLHYPANRFPGEGSWSLDEDGPPALQPSGMRQTFPRQAPGWNFIHTALEANAPIVPFGRDVLDSTAFLCPEDMLTYGYNLQDYHRYCESRIQRTRYVDEESAICERGAVSPSPVDTLIAVASGLTPNCLLGLQEFTSETRIIYFDISRSTLKFKEWLVMNWDGIDYPEAIRAWTAAQQQSRNEADFAEGTLQSKWAEYQACFGGGRAFAQHWDRYRRLPHEYHNVNILTRENDRLLGLLENKNCNIVFWWSNIFHSEYTHHTLTGEQTVAIYQDWIRRLQEHVPHAYVYGQDPFEQEVKGRAHQISLDSAMTGHRNIYYPREVVTWFEKEMAEWISRKNAREQREY